MGAGGDLRLVTIDTSPPADSETITYWTEADEEDDETDDEWVIIRHEETGVTTQSRTFLGALLMLADALNGYEGEGDEDLMDLAECVFVADPEELAELDDAIDDERD